jgi:hypothetical protein
MEDLLGRVVVLPSGERAAVISVEHEYDDGTTLRYLDGPYKDSTTMRDTFLIRSYLKGVLCQKCKKRIASVRWGDVRHSRISRCQRCATGEQLRHAANRFGAIPKLTVSYLWAVVRNV